MSFLLIKWILIFNLLVFLWGIFEFYSYIRLNYDYSSLNYLIGRSITLSFINFLLIIALFLLPKKIYVVIFIIITMTGVYFWIFREIMTNLGEYTVSMEVLVMVEFILFLTYNIMVPGIILLLITYIRKLTPRIHGNILKRYHIHENVFGLLLFFIGLGFIIFRSDLILHERYWNELKIILAFINVFTFVFLFFGSFFLSRDVRDLFKLKFIEKFTMKGSNHDQKNDKKTSIFGIINREDLPFFKKPMVPLFPIGIILTSLSFLMVIYGSDFIPYELFFIPYNTVVLLGYILCCVAAAMIGLDWFRLFKIFYPKLYHKIHHKLEELKKK